MAFDSILADRIRLALSGVSSITERKMFGGLAFMMNGNMLCGVVRNDLMLRVGKQAHEQVLARPHARPMVFTGRPSRGFVYIEPRGLETDRQLAGWIEMAREFVETLPPK